MRIETPADRKMRKNRTAMLLTQRREEIQRENDILGNPEAWDAAFHQAAARRKRELAAQAKTAEIPAEISAGIIKRTETETTHEGESSTGGIDDRTERFLTGFGAGALFMMVTVLIMIGLYFIS